MNVTCAKKAMKIRGRGGEFPLRRRLIAKCVFGLAICVVGCGKAPKIDFDKIQSQIAENGIDSVVEELGQQSGALPKQLRLALKETATAIEGDPSQLWFQLQSRTRLEGWEAFQAALNEQRPNDSLVAKTAGLDSVLASKNMVWSGAIKSWRFSDHGVRFLALSSDGQLAYVGTNNRELIVIDVKQLKTVSRRPGAGLVLATMNTVQGECFCALAHGLNTPPHKLETMKPSCFRIEDLAAVGEIQGYSQDFDRLNLNPSIISSPDGTEIVVGCRATNITANKLVAGRGFEARSFSVPKGIDTGRRILSMRWIDAGRKFLTIDHTGYLRTFENRDGTEASPETRLKVDKDLIFAKFNPSGTHVVFQELRHHDKSEPVAGTLVMWNVASQQEVAQLKFEGAMPFQLAFMDDHSMAIGMSDGEIRVWDGKSAQSTVSIPAHRHTVTQVISLGSNRIMSADSHGYVKVFEVNRKRNVSVKNEVAKFLPEEAAPSAISPDGNRQALLAADGLLIQSVDSEETLFKLPFERMAGVDPRFISIGAVNEPILVVGMQKLIRWMPSTDQVDPVDLDLDKWRSQLRKDRLKTNVFPTIVSPDLKYVVVWDSYTVGVFDALTGRLISVAQSDARFLKGRWGIFSKNRLAIECEDVDKQPYRTQGVRLFNLEKGVQLTRLDHGAIQSGLAFCPAKNLIISSGPLKNGGKDSVMAIRNIDTDEVKYHPFNGQRSEAVGVTYDGARLVTVNRNGGVIYLWDLDSLTVINQFDLMTDVGIPSFEGQTLRFSKSKQYPRDLVFAYRRNPGPGYAKHE